MNDIEKAVQLLGGIVEARGIIHRADPGPGPHPFSRYTHEHAIATLAMHALSQVARDREPVDWDVEPTREEWIRQTLDATAKKGRGGTYNLHPDEIVCDRGGKLRDAIKWSLGEGDSDFGEGPNVRGGRYWWRSELRKRAGEALESQAKPEAEREPVWFEPNDHTKNVCAIRRRSDGYWWQCNSEHGAGWSDKRIRQAWTAREARLEVERHLQGQDVEIVQLMPEPKPSADAAEREGDDVLLEVARGSASEYVEHQAVRELCRRALAQRGGNHGSL